MGQADSHRKRTTGRPLLPGGTMPPVPTGGTLVEDLLKPMGVADQRWGSLKSGTTGADLDMGAPLVTKDERIRRYRHVKTLW